MNKKAVMRIWHSLYMLTRMNGGKKAEYIRKKKIFDSVGNNCRFQMRKIPLYPKLIRIHNNVRIASNVTFVTHDTVDGLIRNMSPNLRVRERIGCIEIMDNVFIGANTTIMYNTRIGSNVVIAAGSVVTKDIPCNSVWGGAPAKYISSFDDLVNKRIDEVGSYPAEFVPNSEGICNELRTFIWEKFDNDKAK